MLDVHPPHVSPLTWRDFLLHIATITVGLLIAIGLEQTVEYFHHRQQVSETRRALLLEQKKDTEFFALKTDLLRDQARSIALTWPYSYICVIIRAHHQPLGRVCWTGDGTGPTTWRQGG